MEDIKNKIEALLYAAGRAVSLNEIRKICRIEDEEAIKKALQDLKIDYDNRDSSLMLINDGDTWKIVTKDNYFGVVKKLVTETELPKSLMETLAVIAWKYPIKQCDLIKVRTNKAYDHLNELERLGYITRQKHGRTKLIKLTDKFFSYFDLPPDKLKQKFSDFNQIASAIANKEKEIELMKEEHKQQVEEAKNLQEQSEQEQLKQIEQQEKEIDLFDKSGNKVKLEQYTPEKETSEEKKSELDVYESEVKEKAEEKLEEYVEKEAEEAEKEEVEEEEPEKESRKEEIEAEEKEPETKEIEKEIKEAEQPEELPEDEGIDRHVETEEKEQEETSKAKEESQEQPYSLEEKFKDIFNGKKKQKKEEEEVKEETEEPEPELSEGVTEENGEEEPEKPKEEPEEENSEPQF